MKSCKDWDDVKGAAPSQNFGRNGNFVAFRWAISHICLLVFRKCERHFEDKSLQFTEEKKPHIHIFNDCLEISFQ